MIFEKYVAQVEEWIRLSQERARLVEELVAALGALGGRPRPLIHETALIGEPPESRDHDGDGIQPDVHGTARINSFVTVDAGCIRATTIGAACLLMTKAHIGHDTILGNAVEVGSGAIVGGGCWVGDGAHIGIGAVIRPRQVIGEGAQIGAGTIVVKDVPPFTTVVGNPAMPIEDSAVLT